MSVELIASVFGQGCNLYEVIGVSATADEKQITRAYKKLALRYHPDKQRGGDDAKAAATTKFQALSAIHSLLSNAESRKYYDETGGILNSDAETGETPSYETWKNYFDTLFPKVTQEDIDKFEQEYRYSEEERLDILRAYETVDGKMEDILNSVMLCTDADETRFKDIIQEAIKNEEVEEIPEWTKYLKKKPKKMTKAQEKRKRAKEEKEAREVEELKKAILGRSDLALTTSSNRGYKNVLSDLEAKYTKPSQKRKKKRVEEEPSEEAFAAARARLEKKRKK